MDRKGEFVYVADMYNQVIRRIDVLHHIVTTFTSTGFFVTSSRANTYPFDVPMGVFLGQNDTTLYVADSGKNMIFVFDLNGTIIQSYGSGIYGFDDGTLPTLEDGYGSLPSFGSPSALVANFQGIIYVGDTGNHLIRKIDDPQYLNRH